MPLPAGAAEGLQLQHTAPYHTAVLFAPTPAAPPAGTAAAHTDIEKHKVKYRNYYFSDVLFVPQTTCK